MSSSSTLLTLPQPPSAPSPTSSSPSLLYSNLSSSPTSHLHHNSQNISSSSNHYSNLSFNYGGLSGTNSEDEYDDDKAKIKTNKKKIKTGKGGSSCHQCKSRRNFTALTYCTSNLDKKNKKCRKKFCGHCLKKFYKETSQGIADQCSWRCPSCRKICCCAACRRRKQKDLGGPITPSPKSPTSSKKTLSPSGDGEYSSTMQNQPMRNGGQYAEEHGHQNHNENSQNMNNNHHPHSHPHSHHQPPVDMLPPVPTVMMPTSLLSSPMTTPLQVPSQFELLPDQLELQDEDDNYIPEPQTTFQNEVKKQSLLAKRKETEFSILYALAQTPKMKKRIAAILSEKDTNQTQKVTGIANLLNNAQKGLI